MSVCLGVKWTNPCGATKLRNNDKKKGKKKQKKKMVMLVTMWEFMKTWPLETGR